MLRVMVRFVSFRSGAEFFKKLEGGDLNVDLTRDYIGFKVNFIAKLVGFGYGPRQIDDSLERLSAILVNKKFSDGRNFLHYLIDSKAGVGSIAAFIEDVFTDSGISVDMPIATFSSIVNDGDNFGINAYDRSFGNDEFSNVWILCYRKLFLYINRC